MSQENVVDYPSKLYSDDVADKVTRPESNTHDEELNFDSDSFDAVKEFFELHRCSEWITKNGYRKVALQFPDCYLRYSFDVAQFLERFDANVYILGDTSYGSCCVDHITAEHANCDSLIHFGNACMSVAVDNIPVLYIFCHYRLNLASFERELRSIGSSEGGNTGKFALLFDSVFASETEELLQIAQEVFDSVEVFRLNIVANSSERCVLGRRVPDGVSAWSDATLVFVGLPSSPLLPIWLMSFVQFTKVLHYMPNRRTIEVVSSTSARLLRKRLYLVEKLRDANSVGLVVGTLAVKGFREAVSRVRELCRMAGKRLYVFSIGKINEAKLSNFADNVDAFILLSCPFGIILNTGEFYKPIVSLFEAEIALNPAKDWFTSGAWTSEFAGFAQGEIGEETETSDVSLITGRIRTTHLKKDAGDENGDERGKQIIQYSAGDYFTNRSWKGLNDEHSSEDVDTTVKSGLDGIAISYASENG